MPKPRTAETATRLQIAERRLQAATEDIENLLRIVHLQSKANKLLSARIAALEAKQS